MNITPGANWSSPSSSAGSDNTNPQLWDMKWFAILSIPLLFVTIIVPIITGPVLHWLFGAYAKLKPFRRVIVVMLVFLILPTTFPWFGLINDRAQMAVSIISTIIVLVLSLHETRRAFRTGHYKVIWLVYCALTIVCGTLDSESFPLPTLSVALPLYLAIHFFIYIRENFMARRGK